MPRQARIDHAGLLHHVIIRGIERRKIFRDRTDYSQFLKRIGKAKGDSQILAWALMPNHGHFLLRTGIERLSKIMRRLLTGYAVYFNKRHQRVGHLFHNRYKSIVCDEDAYLKTLARYIHLNPLKAGLVQNLSELSRYPWCGHGVVLGKAKNDWQAVDALLEQYDENRQAATRQYLKTIEEAVDHQNYEDYSDGTRPDDRSETDNRIQEYWEAEIL